MTVVKLEPNDMVQDFIVRCRGLPFSCTEDELSEWIGGRDIEKVILPIGRDNRPTGEGYIKFKTQSAYDLALKKDRDVMGTRYIEVFAGSPQDKDLMQRGTRQIRDRDRAYIPSFLPSSDYVVRLRGLPFGVEPEEIAQFFSPLEIVRDGIVIPAGRGFKTAGEAFVVFPDRLTAEEALKKDREHIQHRYIEVFKSSQEDMARAVGAPLGGGGGGRSPPGGSYGRAPPSRMRGGDDYYGGGAIPRDSFGSRGARPTPYDRPAGGRYGGSAPPYNYSGFDGGSPGDGPYGSRGGPRGAGGDFGGYFGSFGGGRGPAAGDRGGDFGGRDFDRFDAYNFGVSRTESWRAAVDRSAPSSRRYVLKMRGIPFKATESDVYDFFGSNRPLDVEILFENNGRPAGEARVEFSNRTAYDEALSKDKQYMGSRYVELFPDSGRF